MTIFMLVLWTLMALDSAIHSEIVTAFAFAAGAIAWGLAAYFSRRVRALEKELAP